MVRTFACFLLFLTLASPVLGAGFARVGAFAYTYDGMFTGTRQTSLGQADMAGAFGPDATQLNTAPLPLGDGVEFSFARNQYIVDTDFEIWGGVAEYRGWRLGFTRFRFMMDPQLVRTAYNPEGTGETFDAGDDIDTLSLGYDLGRSIDATGNLQWTIGAAHRRYHSFLTDVQTDASSWDLGTSLGLRVGHDRGWTRLAVAVSGQNVFGSEVDFDERSAALPTSLRAGLTLESAFGRTTWGSEALKVLVALSRRMRQGDWWGPASDHFGAEVTAGGFLALRVGSNSRLPGDLNSWGLGLILDQGFLGPVTLTGGYGEFDTLGGEVEMWSLRARCSF